MLLSECYEARRKTAHFQRNSIKISKKDDYVKLSSGHDGGQRGQFFRVWSLFELIFNINLILITRSFRANVFTHPRTPIQCWWKLLILPKGTRNFREDAIVHLTVTRHAWRARAYPMMKGSIRCHENVISRFYKNSYTAKKSCFHHVPHSITLPTLDGGAGDHKKSIFPQRDGTFDKRKCMRHWIGCGGSKEV